MTLLIKSCRRAKVHNTIHIQGGFSASKHLVLLQKVDDLLLIESAARRSEQEENTASRYKKKRKESSKGLETLVRRRRGTIVPHTYVAFKLSVR